MNPSLLERASRWIRQYGERLRIERVGRFMGWVGWCPRCKELLNDPESALPQKDAEYPFITYTCPRCGLERDLAFGIAPVPLGREDMRPAAEAM